MHFTKLKILLLKRRSGEEEDKPETEKNLLIKDLCSGQEELSKFNNQKTIRWRGNDDKRFRHLR